MKIIPVNDLNPSKRKNLLNSIKKKYVKQPSLSMIKKAKHMNEQKPLAGCENLHSNTVNLRAFYDHEKHKRVAPIFDKMMNLLTIDFKKRYKREKDCLFVKKTILEDTHLKFCTLRRLNTHAKCMFADLVSKKDHD